MSNQSNDALAQMEGQAEWYRMMANCHFKSPGKARRYRHLAEDLETHAMRLKVARAYYGAKP